MNIRQYLGITVGSYETPMSFDSAWLGRGLAGGHRLRVDPQIPGPYWSREDEASLACVHTCEEVLGGANGATPSLEDKVFERVEYRPHGHE